MTVERDWHGCGCVIAAFIVAAFWFTVVYVWKVR